MAAKTIITINRQYGSHGREIGRRVAQELRIPFYDKELIALSSRESGVSQSAFENVDEKPTRSLLYSIVTGASSAQGLYYQQPDALSGDKLFGIQADVIRKVAHESCVIVGRCADYLLRDEPGLISVFLHAPLCNRIENVRADYPNATDKEIEAILRKHDKQRANYYNFYTNQDWNCLFNYDLTINVEAVGQECAVGQIVSLAQKKAELPV